MYSFLINSVFLMFKFRNYEPLLYTYSEEDRFFPPQISCNNSGTSACYAKMQDF